MTMNILNGAFTVRLGQLQQFIDTLKFVRIKIYYLKKDLNLNGALVKKISHEHFIKMLNQHK